MILNWNFVEKIMKNEKIGLIGFGAIGEEVYKKISKKIILGYDIVGIFSNDIESKSIAKEIKCSSFEELLKKKTKYNYRSSKCRSMQRLCRKNFKK